MSGIDAQFRGFSQIRDQLAANGGDANAYYRDLQARRAKIAAALKEILPSSAFSDIVRSARPDLPHMALSELPIAPPKFFPHFGVFGLGTSGFVQMAPATDGYTDFGDPCGNEAYDPEGGFVQFDGSPPGTVLFGGVTDVGPDDPPDNIDTNMYYTWARNWHYLVPFPPPTVTSRFTYSFTASAELNIIWSGTNASMAASLFIGETAKLETGIEITIDGSIFGKLLNPVLAQSIPNYDGEIAAGRLESPEMTIQRSFMVQANNVPAIALVTDITSGLAMCTAVDYAYERPSSMSIYTNPGRNLGRIAYHYEPQLLVKE